MSNSFPPVLDRHTHTLILGTMPGTESLRQQQYYAHPRNAFWPIMGTIFGFDPNLPYSARLAELNRHGIGLWDTLKSCERPGSLDAKIKNARFNDFAALFSAYPNLQNICLNGRGAEKFFRYCCDPEKIPGMKIFLLPSTSPAYAAMSYPQKLEIWRKCLF